MPKYSNSTPVPRSQLALTAQGLIAETNSRDIATSNTVLTAQNIRGKILGLRAGDTVTNLHCQLATSGVGAGYARMALYSVAGVRLGVSGDENAAFVGAAGLLTIALATPYVVTVDGGYYVCVLSDLATTQPAISRGVSAPSYSGAAIGSGSSSMVTQTAQASFPATATFTAGAISFWFGVS